MSNDNKLRSVSIYTGPPASWQLRIHPGFFVHSVTRPSAWVRFWQWFLLGWVWEPIQER